MRILFFDFPLPKKSKTKIAKQDFSMIVYLSFVLFNENIDKNFAFKLRY